MLLHNHNIDGYDYERNAQLKVIAMYIKGDDFPVLLETSMLLELFSNTVNKIFETLHEGNLFSFTRSRISV